MRTLVMSDIHGCYEEFVSLLDKIKLTKEDELIILGDLIDRGPRNMDVVLKVYEMKQDGYNIIILKGNHEEMFLYGSKRYDNFNDLLNSSDYPILSNNGTIASLDEYYKLTEENKSKVIKELITQRSLYKKDNYLFVHAGVMPNVELDNQDYDDLLWVRDEFTHTPHNLPYIVVFGHTPTPYLNPGKEYKIFRGSDKIGMDCGCVFGGKLACLDIYNNKEYYVDNFTRIG